MKILYLSDYALSFKDAPTLEKWGASHSFVVSRLSLDYPFAAQRNLLDASRIIYQMKELLKDPALCIVLCDGQVSLSLMILLESRTVALQELEVTHLLYHKGISNRTQFYKHLMKWKMTKRSEEDEMGFYFTAIPGPSSRNLSETLSFVKRELGQIDFIKSLVPTVTVPPEPIKRRLMPRAPKGENWKEHLVPMFFMFNPSNGTLTICGRRISDNEKVYQTFKDGDPGIYIVNYGLGPKPAVVEKNCNQFSFYRLPNEENIELVDFCDPVNCSHGKKPTAIYRVSHQPNKGYPYDTKKGGELSELSICRDTKGDPRKDRAKICNNSFSPTTRFHMASRLYFSNRPATEIKASLTIGFWVSLGPWFCVKGVTLGESLEETITTAGADPLDFDIIYILARQDDQVTMEDEMRKEWRRVDPGATDFPVTLIDPRDHGFSLDDLTEEPDEKGLFKEGAVLERLMEFVEKNGAVKGDLTTYLISISSTVGMGSLCERIEDLDRTSRLFAREICDRNPGKTVLIPALERPPNRKKHDGGRVFNCEQHHDNEDEESEEKEEEGPPLKIRKDRGIHTNVAVLDFASHYPRQILFHQITVEQNDKGVPILPDIIERLLEQRRIAKQDKDIPREQLLKLLINKIYGWLSYFFPLLGEQVTREGRNCLVKAEELLHKNSITAVFADTDGIFTVGWTEDTIRNILPRIQDQLRTENGAILDYKETFKFLLCCTAKKSYFAITKENKGIGSSLFQDTPSAPNHYKTLMKFASANWYNICRKNPEPSLEDPNVISFLKSNIDRAKQGLNSLISVRYTKTNTVNPWTLFSQEGDKKQKHQMRELVLSSALAGHPVSLNNHKIGHLMIRNTDGTKKKDKHICVTNPMFTGMFIETIGIDPGYSNRHYFINPLVALLHRSLGVTAAELDAKITEMWEQ